MALSLLCLALAASAPAFGRTPQVAPPSRPFVVRVTNVPGGFSVDLPVVARAHGFSTTFFTSLDITNHTAHEAEVDFFYTPADGSAPIAGSFGTLLPFDSIHTEDVLLSLADAGLVPPGRVENTFGTMLVTFGSSEFTTGREATAVARIWSYAAGNSGPTNGTAYRAQPLHTGGAHALAGLVRAGDGLITNVGIENVGIDDGGAPVEAPVTVRLTFFDPASGLAVGTEPTFVLARGQMAQLSDVTGGGAVNAFQLPPGARSLIVFAEAVAGASQIAGYVVWKDTATNDGSFLLMQETDKRL